jgi:hypothetical protein
MKSEIEDFPTIARKAQRVRIFARQFSPDHRVWRAFGRLVSVTEQGDTPGLTSRFGKSNWQWQTGFAEVLQEYLRPLTRFVSHREWD